MEELQTRMSSAEFAEWQAYNRIEPGEPYRSDLRAALISQTIANFLKSKGPMFKLEDFLLKFEQKKQQTVEEAKFRLRTFFTQFMKKQGAKK